jgi:hypothetical protein
MHNQKRVNLTRLSTPERSNTMNVLRLADILGVTVATTCVVLTLPELLDNVAPLRVLGYTFGVVIITNKINGSFRGE